MFMPRKVVEEKLKQMLAEDFGQGDVTSEAVVPAGLTANAEVLAKEEGIAAGIEEIVIFGLVIKKLIIGWSAILWEIMQLQ